jgi:hypothetical protein
LILAMLETNSQTNPLPHSPRFQDALANAADAIDESRGTNNIWGAPIEIVTGPATTEQETAR